jgi:hypothetical protein
MPCCERGTPRLVKGSAKRNRFVIPRYVPHIRCKSSLAVDFGSAHRTDWPATILVYSLSASVDSSSQVEGRHLDSEAIRCRDTHAPPAGLAYPHPACHFAAVCSWKYTLSIPNQTCHAARTTYCLNVSALWPYNIDAIAL